MTKEERPYCVEMDDKFADVIEIRRLGEIEGGFQRPVRDERLGSIIEKAKNGEAIPTIEIAKVDGKFRLLDGQHRFLAWKKAREDGNPFILWAKITPLRATKAVESFCTMNGDAVRLALKHQLAVDPSAYNQKVREVSLKFGLPNSVIHRICASAFRSMGGWKSRHLPLEKTDWEFIENVISQWINDKNWQSQTIVNYFYRQPGMLLLVVLICKNAKNWLKIIPILKKMNFAKSGPFNLRYGMSGTSIKQMKQYANEFIVKHGISMEEPSPAGPILPSTKYHQKKCPSCGGKRRIVDIVKPLRIICEECGETRDEFERILK